MNSKNHNVQDLYLNSLRKEKIPVTIFLTNGARLKGTIKSFDNFVVVLKQDKPNLIYKHAISTIIPERHVDVSFENPHSE